MTDSPFHWTRKVSTARLNGILADARRLEQEGKTPDVDTVEACLAEKDRRLADPNSTDFRPTFF